MGCIGPRVVLAPPRIEYVRRAFPVPLGETSDGLIRNAYTLKIVNMHDRPLRWRITATGIAGL